MGELRTGDDYRPGRIFLPNGEECLALYAGNELVWAKFRTANAIVPRINVSIRARVPSIFTQRMVTVSAPQAKLRITAYAPFVRADKSVNPLVSARPIVQIGAMAPSIRADQRVNAQVSARAVINVIARTPQSVIAGVRAEAQVGNAALTGISSYAPSALARRAINAETSRADINLSALSPTVEAQRRVNVEVLRANVNIAVKAPAVDINYFINITAPRSGIGIAAYTPSVMARRISNAEVLNRADVSLVAQAPEAIGGISANADAPRSGINIVAYSPVVEVVTFVQQRMNKTTFQTISSSTTTLATGMVSDTTYPATISSDTLFVENGTPEGKILAEVLWGRNSVSGTVVFELTLNGVVVDSFNYTTAQSFGNTSTSTNYRTEILEYAGPLNHGDVIGLQGSRSISTSLMFHPGTNIKVVPGDYTGPPQPRQKMVKSSSQNFNGDMPVQFTGWASDETYPAIVVEDSLQVIETGVSDIAVSMTGGTGNASLTVEVRVNGVPLAPTGTAGSSGGSFTIPDVHLNDGDLVTLWVTARSSTQRAIASASVELLPK